MADEVTPTESSATPETVTQTDAAVEPTALGGGPLSDETADAPADAAETDASTEGEAGESEPEKVVPEKYELTVSEGFDLDTETLEAATPIFQDLGLTNDQAQKLIPVAEGFAQQIVSKVNEEIAASIRAERADWLAQAKADAEIGGDKFDATLVTAAKALDGLGFPKGHPFRALLDTSGLGNHPEMIRAFAKVGRALSEDNDFIRTGVATSGERSAAEILYPPKS